MFANFALINPFSRAIACFKATAEEFLEQFPELVAPKAPLVEEVESRSSVASGFIEDESKQLLSEIFTAEEVESLSVTISSLAGEDGRLDIRKLADATMKHSAQTVSDIRQEEDQVVEEIRRYLNPAMSSDSQEPEQGKVLADTGSSGKNWEIKETGTEEAPTILVNIQAAAESANVNQATETPMQHALRNAKRGKK